MRLLHREIAEFLSLKIFRYFIYILNKKNLALFREGYAISHVVREIKIRSTVRPCEAKVLHIGSIIEHFKYDNFPLLFSRIRDSVSEITSTETRPCGRARDRERERQSKDREVYQ